MELPLYCPSFSRGLAHVAPGLNAKFDAKQKTAAVHAPGLTQPRIYADLIDLKDVGFTRAPPSLSA
jgi:hypothetical protein